MEEVVSWYYQESVVSKTLQWTRYRDLEMDMIEEAFQQKQSQILLDRYRIDFRSLLEIHLTDENQTRAVKRELSSHRQRYSCEYRFSSSLPLTSIESSSSCHSFDSWCPFLSAWFKSPSGRRASLDFSRCLEACAQGIIKEATSQQNHSMAEAVYMAEKIRQCSSKTRIEVAQLCIGFYTRDSFLYRTLNKALREKDLSKLETLGPVCYLVTNYSRVSRDYIGTVYRGMHLSSNEIQAYRQAVGQWKTWISFASTSKDLRVAKAFKGNTLFVIEITETTATSARAYDIAHLSRFPDEDEVLVLVGIAFQILNVQEDAPQRYIINVKLWLIAISTLGKKSVNIQWNRSVLSLSMAFHVTGMAVVFLSDHIRIELVFLCIVFIRPSLIYNINKK